MRTVTETPEPTPRLITTAEAAAALGISTETLARWARQGRVTPALTTPGQGRRRIYRWDLNKLREQVSGAPPGEAR